MHFIHINILINLLFISCNWEFASKDNDFLKNLSQRFFKKAVLQIMLSTIIEHDCVSVYTIMLNCVD